MEITLQLSSLGVFVVIREDNIHKWLSTGTENPINSSYIDIVHSVSFILL